MSKIFGPEIIRRSFSTRSISDQFGNTWQYHSQSDRHSKIACWAALFDLLNSCALLREHARNGKVAFGVNHEMRDFQTSRKKVLDLVICTPRRAGLTEQSPTTFAQLGNHFGIDLSNEELTALANLPQLHVCPIGTALVAVEAKAVMTAHIKALPRLHDELDSSHLTIHGDTDGAIAAGLITINASDRFLSTSRNKHRVEESNAIWNQARQPDAAAATVTKVRQIRRRSKAGDQGFDAVGIVLINFKNDGDETALVMQPPAPAPGDADHYENMIGRISALYSLKFSGL